MTLNRLKTERLTPIDYYNQLTILVSEKGEIEAYDRITSSVVKLKLNSQGLLGLINGNNLKLIDVSEIGRYVIGEKPALERTSYDDAKLIIEGINNMVDEITMKPASPISSCPPLIANCEEKMKNIHIPFAEYSTNFKVTFIPPISITELIEEYRWQIILTIDEQINELIGKGVECGKVTTEGLIKNMPIIRARLGQILKDDYDLRYQYLDPERGFIMARMQAWSYFDTRKKRGR